MKGFSSPAEVKKRREASAERYKKNQEKKQREKSKLALSTMKREAKKAFIDAGGIAEDFVDEWGEIKLDLLKSAVRERVSEVLPRLRL